MAPLIRRARGRRVVDISTRSFLIVTTYYYTGAGGARRNGLMVHESVPGDLVLTVLADHFDDTKRGNDVRRRAELPYRGLAAPPGQATDGGAILDFLRNAAVGNAYGYPEDGWTLVRNDDLEGADLFRVDHAGRRREDLGKMEW